MTDRYEFIDSQKAEHKVARMCELLGVSRSGFYEWRDRAESATKLRRKELTVMIKAVFEHNHRTYGYRRVHAVLVRSGVECSLELVRRLMRAAGLVTVQPKPWRWSLTEQDGRDHRIPDLVGRDFTAQAPGQKLIGDITYIPTGEGWLYLATVIDCYSKKVIGWATADHYKTPLIEAALDAAIGQITLQPDAIFHSDRGSNYTSYDYAQKLASLSIRQSVGATGVCWDNAMAESFFSSLKNEWLHHQEFDTHAQARQAIIYYIEGFYNNRRLHSGIGYRTPTEAENQYHHMQLAA